MSRYRLHSRRAQSDLFARKARDSSKVSRRHSDARAGELLDNVPAAIVITDRAGQCIDVNAVAEQVLGATPDGLPAAHDGRACASLRHDALDQLAVHLTGGHDAGEIALALPDGARRTIEFAARQLDSGRRLCVLRDISERKRLEAVVHHDARLVAILARIGRLIAGELDLTQLLQIITDEATKLTRAEFGSFFYNHVDERGETYMLYALSGAPREAFSRYPMPRNTDVFAPAFHGDGPVRSDDITCDPRYGKSAPYYGMPPGHVPVRSYLAVPVACKSGEVIGGLFFGHSRAGVFTRQDEDELASLAAQAAVAISNARLYAAAHQEIEERRRVEESLARQTEALRQQADLIEAAHDAVLVMDVDRTIRFWNKGAEEMYGWAAVEALGQCAPSLLQTRLPEPECQIAERLERTGRWRGELRHTRRDGREIVVDSNWVFTQRPGEGRSLLEINRDVTERKRAEDVLRQNAVEIEALNVRLKRAMAETHHRVKNNLQMIAGLVDMELMDHPESVPSDAIARLGSHVRTLAMVHDLLTSHARLSGEAHHISIREVFGRLLPLMQATASKRRIVSRVEVDVELCAHQGTSLALISSELINNALKHGRGDVEVTFTMMDSRVELQVCDDGPGFPEGFTPARSDTTGVALVENLSRWDLRGDVRYENRPEGGARIVVTFPP